VLRAVQHVETGQSITTILWQNITTRRHNPQDHDLNLHGRENPKSLNNVISAKHSKNKEEN